MARNFVQPGDVITLTAPVAVKSGGVVHVGALIGVAAYDAPEGAEVETALTGVFELPKGKAALEQGALAYWDANSKTVTDFGGRGLAASRRCGRRHRRRCRALPGQAQRNHNARPRPKPIEAALRRAQKAARTAVSPSPAFGAREPPEAYRAAPTPRAAQKKPAGRKR